MSKPKPGLGKVVRRTLAQGTQSNHSLGNGPISIHHAPVVVHAPSSVGSSGTRRDFATLGIPPPPRTGGPGGSGGSGGLREGTSEKEAVAPFRTTYRSSTSSSRHLSTLSPPAPVSPWTSFDLPAIVQSLPSFPSLSFSLSTLSGQSDKAAPGALNGYYSSNYDLDPVPLSPSPPPTLRSHGRAEYTHTALSPYTVPTDPNLAMGAGFVTLGLPVNPLFSPLPATNPTTVSGTNTTQYIFHLGAAGLAKERPAFKPSSRRSSPPPPARARSFPLPHVDPPTSSELRSVGVGEDAYFARSDGMCIADGVGGWARSGRGGADAGRWSRLLTHFCEVEMDGKSDFVEEMKGTKEGSEGWTKKVWEAGGKKFSTGNVVSRRKRSVDPVEIMQRGYEKCLSCFTAEGIHGSSTCLLALLHNATLSVANLGDCCLLLIRGDEIVFRTDEMQHAFNFPLQVGTHSRDEPMKDAKRYDVAVGRGDVVVLGSDGLMDNLFDEDILETLAQFAPPHGAGSNRSLPPFSPQQVSEELCRRARAVSEQVSATTPFMVRAIEEGIDFVGGKKDDISVVVGVIGEREGPTQGGLAMNTSNS